MLSNISPLKQEEEEGMGEGHKLSHQLAREGVGGRDIDNVACRGEVNICYQARAKAMIRV